MIISPLLFILICIVCFFLGIACFLAVIVNVYKDDNGVIIEDYEIYEV